MKGLINTVPSIILGIDPGTIMMGYGIIKVHGQSVQCLDLGVLKMNPKLDNYRRLQQIHSTVLQLIQTHQPEAFAIEAPFFGKNVQSMLKLGRAQGVAIAAAIQAGLPVTEYSPKKVKQVITGNGNADKNQVWMMLQRLLSFQGEITHLDASDALGVALCHHLQGLQPIAIQKATAAPRKKAKSNNWEAFLQQNPDRKR